jgi:hypothetical protein
MASVQPFDDIARVLKQLGLDDINVLVKLMFLSAASRIWLPKQSDSTTLLHQVINNCHGQFSVDSCVLVGRRLIKAHKTLFFLIFIKIWNIAS